MSTLDLILRDTERPPLAWPLPTQHLSASALSRFLRCPESFRRHYIAGENEPMNAKLLWGRADDDGHDVNFLQKIDTHEDIPVDDLKEAFAAAFEETVERSGGPGEIDWEGEKPGELKDAGIALASLYHREVSPQIQPVAIEREFSATVPGVPVPIVGFVDVVTETRKLERKTAKQTAKVVKPEWRIQGLVYLLGDPDPTPVNWHVSVKTKTPSIVTPELGFDLMLPHTPAQVDRAERMIQNLARAIVATYMEFGPDEPWPGNIAHTWACGMCAFRPTCAWWS